MAEAPTWNTHIGCKKRVTFSCMLYERPDVIACVWIGICSDFNLIRLWNTDESLSVDTQNKILFISFISMLVSLIKSWDTLHIDISLLMLMIVQALGNLLIYQEQLWKNEMV